MLDVRRMKVLREVAARGSFSAAAESLAYTQSAVSQQIAALEREAGTTLVDRSARGVRLTDAGHALVGHADAILSRLADAEAELEALAGIRSGRVRMTAFPTAASTLMPVAIARYRERYPGVDVTMQLAEPDQGIAALRSGEADLALIIEGDFQRPRDDGVERTHLLDDPMYVALPAGHALAGKSRLKLTDLRDDAWMLGSTDQCADASIFLRSCRAAGFEPRVAFHSDDYLAIQGFVAAGMGVSFIPDLALVTVRDDVVIRSLGAKPPLRKIFVASLADSYCSPAKSAMREILVEVAGEFGVGRVELALAS